MPTQTIPTAAIVRSWAQNKGLASTRGRLSNQAIEAYNRSHKSKFVRDAA